jgi:hypothetical protein
LKVVGGRVLSEQGKDALVPDTTPGSRQETDTKRASEGPSPTSEVDLAVVPESEAKPRPRLRAKPKRRPQPESGAQTRQDLEAATAEVQAEIAAAKAEAEAQIAAVKAEAKAQIAAVKAEAKAQIATAKSAEKRAQALEGTALGASKVAAKHRADAQAETAKAQSREQTARTREDQATERERAADAREARARAAEKKWEKRDKKGDRRARYALVIALFAMLAAVAYVAVDIFGVLEQKDANARSSDREAAMLRDQHYLVMPTVSDLMEEESGDYSKDIREYIGDDFLVRNMVEITTENLGYDDLARVECNSPECLDAKVGDAQVDFKTVYLQVANKGHTDATDMTIAFTLHSGTPIESEDLTGIFGPTREADTGNGSLTLQATDGLPPVVQDGGIVYVPVATVAVFGPGAGQTFVGIGYTRKPEKVCWRNDSKGEPICDDINPTVGAYLVGPNIPAGG